MYRHICSYSFQLVKHTHTLNKIVEIKPAKKWCQKTSNLGGHKIVTTQKFRPQIVYNHTFPVSRSEMNTNKSTALKWFTYNKAFQKIDETKSYAQALKKEWPVGMVRQRQRAFLVGMLCRKFPNAPLRSINSRLPGMLKILVHNPSEPLTQVWLSIKNTIQCLRPHPCHNKKSQTKQQKLIKRKVLVSL